MTLRSTFHVSSITRAISAARKAGLRVDGVSIKPDGTIVVHGGDSSVTTVPDSPIDGQASQPSKWEDVEA